jgi:tetratricopeptide (TPR) repeat protein
MEGFDNLAAAKEYFDKSQAELPNSDAGELASLRRSQIDKLEEYLTKIASSDSLPDPEIHIALAEVYLLDLNRPDSALAHYQKAVQLMPLSQKAPPTAYAAAWVVENILGDTAASRAMYQDLIATYPFSESANAARKRLGQATVMDTSEQNAAERLNWAENLLLRENDVNGALALYESIVRDFPQSPYAPKAECAIAWTLWYMKGDPDSAKTIFEGLALKYPNSQCALLAEKKLAAKPAEAEKDTTGQTPAVEEPLESQEEEEKRFQEGDEEELREMESEKLRGIEEEELQEVEQQEPDREGEEGEP